MDGDPSVLSDNKNALKISRVALSDVDLFSEWKVELGRHIESTQLSAGRTEIGFDHFASPEVVVGNFRSMKSMLNRFEVADGLVMFFICRKKQSVIWNGMHFPSTLMGVVSSGVEHWMVLPDGWDCYEFILSEDLIRRTELLPPVFFAETTPLERAFLPLMEPSAGRFLQWMDACFQVARASNGSFGAALPSARFFHFVIEGLQHVVDADLSARGSLKLRRARRPDLVRRGKDFVSTHLSTNFSINDMARALDSSQRVLSYAFKESLGIGPYQFVLTEKLHAARRKLKSGDSVTDASVSLGFYTPSRFTRQYVRLFGELPSATRPARQAVSVS